jgi:rhamnosyl/mannosyltransferase
MRQVVVIGKYYPPYAGGIEFNTQQVSRLLSNSHAVLVHCFNHEQGTRNESDGNNLTIIRHARFLTFSRQPLSLRMVWDVVRATSDLVHLHAPNFVGVAALLLKQFLGRERFACVVTHHTDVNGRGLLKPLLLPLYRAVIRSADAIIVTSEKNAALSDELKGARRIATIPLCIDLERYPFAPRKNARRSIGTASGRVGYMGRLVSYKGADVLIRALPHLPGVSAVLAGDGPFRGALVELAARLAVTDRVSFIGSVASHEDKLRFLGDIDAFIFPSTGLSETFGIVQLEAMAVGAPVIASALPTGVTDVAIHDQTALLFPPRDEQALAAAIDTLLCNPSLAARLAANARRHVEQNFCETAVLSATKALFRSLLEEDGYS